MAWTVLQSSYRILPRHPTSLLSSLQNIQRGFKSTSLSKVSLSSRYQTLRRNQPGSLKSPTVTAPGPVFFPPTHLSDNRTINVIFKDSFKVSANATVPKFGPVRRFDSLKMGSTQIRVTTEFEIEPLPQPQFYDLRLVLRALGDGQSAAIFSSDSSDALATSNGK